MKRVLGWMLLSGLFACGTKPRARPIPGDHETALKVEVLNASGRAGEARTGTRLLRQAGIDVVYFGNAAEASLDSTLIIVRRGSVGAGERVRRVLGIGRVDVQLERAPRRGLCAVEPRPRLPPVAARTPR